MSNVENPQDKNLADKLSFARSSGSWSAWAELLRRFDYKQRQHLANLLAHDWTINELKLEPCSGFGEEVVVAKIDLKSTELPSRGKEDPKLQELQDNEKAIAALMAENQRLRARANSSQDYAQGLEKDVLSLLSEVEVLLSASPCQAVTALLKITEFKNSYLIS